ncbi:hypothetical protein GUJ93_ZPchr0011g26876 [Zizania palustris]|uniref:Uncharacterized protein n=1 Tax=Zizania palustris TaxID=103762 RepID=A0A8J5WIT0_ZIZPA|nr:hypothetical protein GUJ93_ZPchr0011g26876 [Zizania palustris]
MSDDGGKVDIPEFFEELSGEDCCEENIELKASSGSMMKSFSEAGVPSEVGGQTNVGVDVVPADVSEGAGNLSGTHKPKRMRKVKAPPVALRKSARIKRDGISIPLKAQQRKISQDEHADVGVNLGSTSVIVEENISLLKAKEMAQALVCLAKEHSLLKTSDVEASVSKGNLDDSSIVDIPANPDSALASCLEEVMCLDGEGLTKI